MKVVPTCRYGHGNLEHVDKNDVDHRWGLMGLSMIGVQPATDSEPRLIITKPSDRVFTVQLYRCPECGYLEAFDDEVGNG